jgi:chloride channel protein, CIC family
MAESNTPAAAPAPDPAAILRSRNFVGLLVFAAVLGIVVSLVGWGFLELVHAVQVWVFTDLPSGLGLDPVPTWWPLPICTLAGLPVAFAIARLPGNGGHVPAHGLQVGSTQPNMVPGIALAALATLGLGLVLGPEAPLIAIGTGVAVFTVQLAKRDAPPQLLLVLGAAGAFAAISVVFGSPIMAAIVIIEASGLGGATLPLILIPGLVAAGIGSLVFIGMTNWSGLSTSAYSLAPLALAAFGTPTLGEIAWTIALGIAAALVTFPIRKVGLRVASLVPGRTFVVVPAVGLLVAGLAFVFAQLTDEPANLVLFSGQDALGGLVADAGTLTVGTLILLVLCKGLAWGLSLGSFRGGPTFPAMFIGAAGGIAASHLPGLPSSVAIPVAMGAMIAAVLRLPLSAIVIASLLCASAGPGAAPLVIVGVVAAYLTTLALEGRLGAPAIPAPSPDSDAPLTSPPPPSAGD